MVPADSTGSWEIRTGSKIGVVFGDEWELRVLPKLNVPRLMFLLAYARDLNGWKRLSTLFTKTDDVIAALATGFAVHATSAIEGGLLRGYALREEASSMVRGRVRFGEQLSRGGGLPLPVQVAYDDFTEDILENRMLLTASELLLRLPNVPPVARRLLQRVRVVLDQVEPIQDWRGIKAPQTTRLNGAYEPALRLAELILSSASITASVGDVRDIRSTTFVFDMNKVFEDFVTNAFRSSMRRHGGVVRDQVKPYSLDEAGSLPLKPDLSWWVGAKCLAVLDAKYKAIDAGVIQHPDAYQMLAYCTAYGLPRGYLVYAKDSGAEARTHVIRNSGQEIIVATLDVEKEPDELLVDVAHLADDVVRRSRTSTVLVA